MSQIELYKIKSRTSDKVYEVRKFPNGVWRCTCKGYAFRSSCHHIYEAKMKLINAIKKIKEKQAELEKQRQADA